MGESFTETQNGETKIDFELPTARPRVYIDKDKDRELLLKAAEEEPIFDLLDQLRLDDPWEGSLRQLGKYFSPVREISRSNYRRK